VGNNEQEQAIRVLIADDQGLMRDGLASLLSIQEGIAVIGTAANGKHALELALTLRPDVILMDVRMPIMDGVAATAQIRRQLPSCQILMLTTFDDEQYVIQALLAGASGYLLKDIPANDLAKAVQAVHKGIYQLDPSIAGKFLTALAQPRDPASRPSPQPQPVTKAEHLTTNAHGSKVADLTGREIEVLRLIAQGATNREIAETLIISEGTVKNHISSILSRLRLRDRTQAAIYARECGLL